MLDSEVPFIPWEEFEPAFKWKQGEHLTLVGPTGGGKTTLATMLLPRRDYVLVLATKKRDPLISRLRKDGYETITNAEAINKQISHRFILAPPLSRGVSSLNRQRNVFEDALNTAFRQTGWTVYLDEARYVCDYLGLAAHTELLWQQGRSLGVTMVAGTQRPVRIPLFAYDQATHLFFWRDNDEQNLKRIGGLGGVSARRIKDAVGVLALHEVLYLNTRTGSLARTKPSV
jgi:hypothetical protein